MKASKNPSAHVIVWEFIAPAGREREFEEVYGPRGEWARLFARGVGYLGSELWRDAATPRRYWVIDRWETEAAFEAFKSRHHEEYEALDRRCEALTEKETRLGGFVSEGG